MDQPLIDEIRREVTRRRRDLEQGNGEPRPLARSMPRPATWAPITCDRLDLQPGERPRARSVHINELLRFHDRPFVEAAYLAILGRPMDQRGELSVNYLRAGGSKLSVLRWLRDSTEGRNEGVELRGFTWLRLHDMLSNLPVVGYGFRWLWSLATLPTIVRYARHAHQDAMWRLDEVQRVSNRNAERAEAAELRRAGSGDNDGIGRLAHRFDGMRADLDRLGGRMRKFFDELDAGKPDFDFEDFYRCLEDKFRESSELVSGRQRPYLEAITQAGAGTPDRPVLDLGCGRGEWLALLRDAGLTARGIDTSDVFLAQCRDAGLEVAKGDVLPYLQSLPPASYGAITSFQLIEHLPALWQIRMVELAFRALRPGGVVIFETPNPEHLAVAALRFYVDPTHIRPVPSALLRFAAEYVGFENIEIRYTAPSDDVAGMLPGWSTYQDYALVARRPAMEG